MLGPIERLNVFGLFNQQIGPSKPVSMDFQPAQISLNVVKLLNKFPSKLLPQADLSSVGRAEDCSRGAPDQISLGRWFESGRSELMNYVERGEGFKFGDEQQGHVCAWLSLVRRKKGAKE
ncbi:hypothetical protein Ancab_017376 [Ancistrocladus abbreviatus]